MEKNKKVIISTSCIIVVILLISLMFSVVVNCRNALLKKNAVDVVIYQLHVKDFSIINPNEKTLYYRTRFTKDTTYDEVIYAIDNSKNYNRVVINNGTIYISEANCYNHICEKTVITLDANNCHGTANLLNPVVITCQPHGLIITLEAALEN